MSRLVSILHPIPRKSNLDIDECIIRCNDKQLTLEKKMFHIFTRKSCYVFNTGLFLLGNHFYRLF